MLDNVDGRRNLTAGADGPAGMFSAVSLNQRLRVDNVSGREDRESVRRTGN